MYLIEYAPVSFGTVIVSCHCVSLAVPFLVTGAVLIDVVVTFVFASSTSITTVPLESCTLPLIVKFCE